MRMRRKPHREERMANCAEVMAEGTTHKGRWLEDFPGFSSLELELGCGKGRFTADTAESEPGTLLVALEKAQDALVTAMERICARSIGNVRFVNGDAANLADMFEKGEVSVIYINFCDPWPKSRDAKFRLTAPGFLRKYADLLPENGEIRFKTDNLPLFTWSVEQFTAEGWELHDVTNDLHRDGVSGIMTDYEAKFVSEGIRINRLVARKTAGTKDSSAGPVERLRNAALADARGNMA